MNSADTQAINVINQIIGKCSGPSYSEFATFQQCMQQLSNTIETQAKELKEPQLDPEA